MSRMEQFDSLKNAVSHCRRHTQIRDERGERDHYTHLKQSSFTEGDIYRILGSVLRQSDPLEERPVTCVNNNDCGIFQVCVNNVCVANNQGCNPPCMPPQVCVAPMCVAPPPAATTTAAPGAVTTTSGHASHRCKATCPFGGLYLEPSAHLTAIPVVD
ncbi:unnamed protein product [Toxocara canis]|uniref:WAP domain-containing protein n=1 Tax=Toxocara canis TaxID=6265 RepID=A0A183V6Z0_TOXCA|nr:unnamed protein product [Toxocara canis]